MYILLLIALLAAAAGVLLTGVRRASRGLVAAGLAGLVASIALFPLLDLWGELLWFEAVGYERRFWTILLAKLAAGAAGASIGALVVSFLAREVTPPAVRRLAALVGSGFCGLLGLGTWDEALLFLNRRPAGVADPILGRDAGFYLFELPLFDRLYAMLLCAVAIAAALTLVASVPGKRPHPFAQVEPLPIRPLLRSSAALALLLALGCVLSVFHLMYSEWGVVAGPGWTDAHVRLPAWVAVAAVTLALGLAPLLPGFRARALRCLPRRVPAGFAGLVGAWAGIGSVWLVGLVLAPNLVQWLVVEPNEISFERKYIAHNIDFTRRGFALHEVEERSFPAADELSEDTLRDHADLISEVRLWDWRALDSVYKQFQEIRLYYEFEDVDIDRYRIGDRYRQVMVSARELQTSNLPPQSRTFVNERFKYTHGYGLTMAAVRDFTPDGLPNLLVKDIPPRSAEPELAIHRPQIYYGELTGGPVVANSKEEEFDYPSGDKNVYARYAGGGGVHLRSLWRKFVFGWKFDGTKFFLSSYPGPESRILFHREVRERVRAIAPFLRFDDDPYVVLVDGRLHWIVDAYTTSTYFPYSEPFDSSEVIEYEFGDSARRLVTDVEGDLDGANYVRNSVKAVVDAYDGSVDFYAFDAGDPLLGAWRSALPGVFRDAQEMPAELREHVRYPADFLLAQGIVYAKYHMGDPTVFYNQEDLWVRATEKYHSAVQPVVPYYVMWEPPGSERAEFVLMLPFTPKNRQVLIGWIAGMCDGDNYGRFLVYKFPKERRVLGPQQVETKIDQDRFLSGQLTLWDQRGSQVIRGNVLALPIADTLLYVEPIYLQAETAAYPELRLVAVMHGDRLSYAETFDAALRGLFAPVPGTSEEAEEPATLREMGRRANEAFERYLELQAEGRFEEAGRELDTLRSLLQRMASDVE